MTGVDSAVNRDLAAELLQPERFRPVVDLLDAVPDGHGVYAVRVLDADALPEPFRAHAHDRGTDLLYIGSATGRSLKRRMIHDELEGRGHGTFFRSIGVVLGYRPLVGSLVGSANHLDFSFETEDILSITQWLRSHVEVSWVQVEDGAEAISAGLVHEYTPLLNLRGNPAALAELKELRKVAVMIAGGPHAPLEPT
ncbi:MAG: GIY-YIG nuclease family protein [Galactobacter sp.]